jgi:hypothetical protein
LERSPDLNRAATLAHFQIFGKWLLLMERLSNLVTDLLIEQDAHFKSLALILSKPIALLVFKVWSCART